MRILAMEPTTHRSYGPYAGATFFNHANERLRILGEIPLRKFDAAGKAIKDVDGNPDTSSAKIPADVPFTFQTIDKNGLVLNMSQTWHQVRPVSVTIVGAATAHAQVGTDFCLDCRGAPRLCNPRPDARHPLVAQRRFGTDHCAASQPSSRCRILPGHQTHSAALLRPVSLTKAHCSAPDARR